MNKDLKKLDQIRASRETYNELADWVEKGNVPYSLLPKPLEYGLLMFDDLEYILFDRNEDVIRFLWHKNDKPYASFEYELSSYRLDNIRSKEPIEIAAITEETYKPFYYIVSSYMGAMAFIVANIDNKQAVDVNRSKPNFVYILDHTGIELKEFELIDSLVGQFSHFVNFTANWNRNN